jgi:hypothetical protein
MADFFKGLTGGFQSGLQLGEAMRAKQEREALAQIMQEKPVSTGPDFAGQFRMQGLEQGPMPQAEPIQDTQSFMGQQYAQSALTPDKVAGLRYGAMADVIAQRDPAAALRMRQEQTRMEREAIEAPLRTQALETQVKAGKLGLTKAEQDIETGNLTLAEKKRLAEDAERMNNFNKSFGEANAKAQAEGRTLTPNDIATLAKASNLSYSQENELIASQVNRTKAEVDQFRLDVEKTIQGKGFESLIDLHKNDKRFGDGMHFVPEVDPKTGGVTMARVNEATGRVEERLKFKTKAEATAYLREEAANPANAAIWLQNYQKGAATIAELEAGTGLKRAQADYFANGAGSVKGTLKQKVADFREVYGRDPTDDEKGVLAGLTNKPREFTAADVTARAKLMVDGGMMDPDDSKKPLSPQKAIQMAQAELSGVPYVSPVDKLIADMAKARSAGQGIKTDQAPAVPRQPLVVRPSSRIFD